MVKKWFPCGYMMSPVYLPWMLQSMDPLPMHGRDLGVNPDHLIEAPEVEQEAKQEILENKDVSFHVTKAKIIT